MTTTYRFYGDLAIWWPLISPPREYAEEAAYAGTLLRSASSSDLRRLSTDPVAT
ncbi:MAG: hypothetical protein ACRDV9_13350 [Acidimicrobiia bacterium]